MPVDDASSPIFALSHDPTILSTDLGTTPQADKIARVLKHERVDKRQLNVHVVMPFLERSQLRVCHIKANFCVILFLWCPLKALIFSEKMFVSPLIFVVLVTLFNGIFSKSVELTFELPDSAVECFYQDIEKNTSASLEYQVKLFSLFLQCDF